MLPPYMTLQTSRPHVVMAEEPSGSGLVQIVDSTLSAAKLLAQHHVMLRHGGAPAGRWPCFVSEGR